MSHLYSPRAHQLADFAMGDLVPQRCRRHLYTADLVYLIVSHDVSRDLVPMGFQKARFSLEDDVLAARLLIVVMGDKDSHVLAAAPADVCRSIMPPARCHRCSRTRCLP